MIEAKSTESICVVQNIQEQSGSARAKFLCTIENLESKDYYSLRYNNSESICGVPKDEILLDPVLTNKYKSNILIPVRRPLRPGVQPSEKIQRLHEGHIIPLDTTPGKPVSIIKDGVSVARGEVLVIDEMYAIKIID